MTTLDRGQPSDVAAEVRDVYRTVVAEARSRDAGSPPPLGPDPPVDLPEAAVADRLTLPLDLWDSGAKPTRTEPALVAADAHLTAADRERVAPVLVGLDVLVTMLDEWLDSRVGTGPDRLDLAVNVAFGSLCSFASIPDDLRAAVVPRIQSYFLTVAGIPVVERAVSRRLAAVADPADAMDLVRYAYARRAQDITAFATVPALVAGLGEATTDRLAADLQTHRAHYLLFDDVRDVEQDRRNGTETPVTWLLDTHESPAAVQRRLLDVYATFEYAETDYRERLRALERRPESLRDEIGAALDATR